MPHYYKSRTSSCTTQSTFLKGWGGSGTYRPLLYIVDHKWLMFPFVCVFLRRDPNVFVVRCRISFCSQSPELFTNDVRMFTSVVECGRSFSLLTFRCHIYQQIERKNTVSICLDLPCLQMIWLLSFKRAHSHIAARVTRSEVPFHIISILPQ